MAEILKINTPMIDRQSVGQARAVADPSIPFNMSDISKVTKPGPQSEILKQHTGMMGEESPAILMNMLKDPAITVNFLKNIYMLQEIIKLLPAHNSVMTDEINQMFDTLLINSEDIAGELLRQENASTSFKGELFDLLRGLLANNSKSDMYHGVSDFLKAINAILCRQDVLESVANNLLFLADSMSSSKTLGEKLLNLAESFLKDDAADKFIQLKSDTLALLKEVEGSILFSPKLEKVLPMIIYNLSRFNDNPNFLNDTLSRLLTMIDSKEQKNALILKLSDFLSEGIYEKAENSKVMDSLAKILGKYTSNDELSLMNADKSERIIHSLLSSPCNFTPLLHFIIPVQSDNVRSFAEVWVDPNGKQEEKGVTKDAMHMLIVFDIEGIGQFEAELFIIDTKITLNLLCPPAYERQFAGIVNELPKISKWTSYSFGEIYIGTMQKQRSLMEIFKTLPHRRMGIDVKV